MGTYTPPGSTPASGFCRSGGSSTCPAPLGPDHRRCSRPFGSPAVFQSAGEVPTEDPRLCASRSRGICLYRGCLSSNVFVKLRTKVGQRKLPSDSVSEGPCTRCPIAIVHHDTRKTTRPILLCQGV